MKPFIQVTPDPYQMSAFCPCFQIPLLVQLSFYLPFMTVKCHYYLLMFHPVTVIFR